SHLSRRLWSFSLLSLRYECGLLSIRHLGSSRPTTCSQTRFARWPYVELGPRHATRQGLWTSSLKRRLGRVPSTSGSSLGTAARAFVQIVAADVSPHDAIPHQRA